MSKANKKLGRVDPLDLLKEFTIKKKIIKLKDDNLIFDHIKFPLHQETPFKSPKTNIQYNLGSLWLYLEQMSKKMNYGQYANVCNRNRLTLVNKLDQEQVENYFTGVIEETSYINEELKLQIYTKKVNVKNETKKNLGEEEKIVKKVKVNDQNENQMDEEEDIKVKTQQEEQQKQRDHLSIMDWIIRTEKPITSKTRLLKASNQRDYREYLKFLNDQSRAITTRQEEKQITNIQGLSLLKRIIESKQRPIVVIPAYYQPGNICLKNAKQFFEDGQYIDLDVNKIEFKNSERKVEVLKDITGYNVTFEFVDQIPSIKEQDWWKRVVAVFVSGSQYQLKNWPDGNQLGLLFSKYRGFYLHYADKPIDEFVKNCNVKFLEIYKSKRIFDIQARNIFWEEIEKFLIKL